MGIDNPLIRVMQIARTMMKAKKEYSQPGCLLDYGAPVVI